MWSSYHTILTLLRDSQNNISQDLEWGATPPRYPLWGKFYTMPETLSKPTCMPNMKYLVLIVSEILKIFEKLEPTTPLRGHRRWSKVVPLDSQEGVSY